jgi:GNAT superfamily N-acetyltransferase
VWSISCFLMKKQFRRKGLTLPLLKEALSFAESYGAEIVEGYPADTKGKIQADVFVWTGILSTFLKAGFKEMPRNSPSRPIVRYYIN